MLLLLLLLMLPLPLLLLLQTQSTIWPTPARLCPLCARRWLRAAAGSSET